MIPTGPLGAPAGWYPDPSGFAVWRWWDGYTWTGHVSSPPSSPPQPAFVGQPLPPGFLSVHDRFATEQRAVPWGKRAFFGYLVIIGLELVTARLEGSWLRKSFDIGRIQARTGAGYVDVHQPGALTAAILLMLAVEIPVFIVLLTWQYRAAKTAELLRLPAAVSPGLGVAGWFIPIVNFWFPYQAIRDCLPPEDAGRRVVARMWAYFIATIVSNVITVVLALVGTPAGYVVAAVTMAFGFGFALLGARSVQLIADTHRRILYPSRPTEAGG